MTPTPLGYHSRESSATPVHMRRMSTPRVESPRLDSYRYSLINLEETLEHDLDAILGELCALESNFDLRRTPPRQTTGMSSLPDNDMPTDLPPPPAPLQLQLEDLLASEPQYISPESVRQAKMMAKRTDSPDADSAFCENTSSRSSGSSNNTATFKHPSSLGLLPSSRKTSQESAKSCSSSASTTSSSASASTTTTNTALLLSPSDPQDAAARAKAEKIRLAIEKIKEASVKKIFIKVFGEDGSAKSLLVDERMTVAKVCRMLADKNYVKRDTSWGLVELLPDLHMERAYEDHEMLVENLLMWKADSKNTLWFIKRPEVYDLFNR
jgi:amyloid beta A4 precursor protein-binding family B protein 1-interacting protein